MNTVTAYQKASDCGEIRFHFKTDETEITPAIVARVERELLANPGHQMSYYDLLLVDENGKELDFETNILGATINPAWIEAGKGSHCSIPPSDPYATINVGPTPKS